MPSIIGNFETVIARNMRCEEGAIPVLNLYFIMAMPTFGGIAEDVATTVVYLKGDIPCLGDGIYAEGRVDTQSNNRFMNGSCTCSNLRVGFNNGNFFESDDRCLPGGGAQIITFGGRRAAAKMSL